jgi:hypothetical protein
LLVTITLAVMCPPALVAIAIPVTSVIALSHVFSPKDQELIVGASARALLKRAMAMKMRAAKNAPAWKTIPRDVLSSAPRPVMGSS